MARRASDSDSSRGSTWSFMGLLLLTSHPMLRPMVVSPREVGVKHGIGIDLTFCKPLLLLGVQR